MSDEVFKQPDHDADNVLQAPDLRPLREAAEHEELSEARAGLADELGNPLSSGDPRAPLARDVAQALTEAGFTLHDCVPYHPRYRLGGVCLLPVAAGHNPDGSGGIAVSWTTHDLLALDWERGREHQGTQRTMNHALADVLSALGNQVRPFGSGGASLVASSRHSSSAAARSEPSRRRR
jgi:hypothetical protein